MEVLLKYPDNTFWMPCPPYAASYRSSFENFGYLGNHCGAFLFLFLSLHPSLCFHCIGLMLPPVILRVSLLIHFKIAAEIKTIPGYPLGGFNFSRIAFIYTLPVRRIVPVHHSLARLNLGILSINIHQAHCSSVVTAHK